MPTVSRLLLFVLATTTVAIAAAADPVYRWRSAAGRHDVLWLGGGHWHDTLLSASLLRAPLEGSGAFHVTYTEQTAALLRSDRAAVLVLHGMLADITPDEEQALLAAVAGGKPLLVLHAASASFRQPPPASVDPVAKHPEFYRMLGGHVQRHPPLGPVTVKVVKPAHPVTAGVADFTIQDELFLFRALEPDNEVLLTTAHQGEIVPLAWTRLWQRGRVVHLSLGHDRRAVAHPAYQQLVLQALSWLADSSPRSPTP